MHHLANRVDQHQVLQFKQNQIDPILKLWPLLINSRSLNDSQLYSIMLAMKNKFQLIQGPPGLYTVCTYIAMYLRAIDFTLLYNISYVHNVYTYIL